MRVQPLWPPLLRTNHWTYRRSPPAYRPGSQPYFLRERYYGAAHKIEASGMRVGNIDRVKRQLLHEAVTDNLDTMRGRLPRSVRPVQRVGRKWWHRAPLLVIPLTLLGATYVVVSESRSLAVSQLPVRQPTTARPRNLATAVPDISNSVQAMTDLLTIHRLIRHTVID